MVNMSGKLAYTPQPSFRHLLEDASAVVTKATRVGERLCVHISSSTYIVSLGGAGSRDTVRAKLQSVYFAQSLRLEENDNGDFSKSYLPIGRGSAHTNAKLEATGRNRTH